MKGGDCTVRMHAGMLLCQVRMSSASACGIMKYKVRATRDHIYISYIVLKRHRASLAWTPRIDPIFIVIVAKYSN